MMIFCFFIKKIYTKIVIFPNFIRAFAARKFFNAKVLAAFKDNRTYDILKRNRIFLIVLGFLFL